MSSTLPPSEGKRSAKSYGPWMNGENGPKRTRRNGKPPSEGAKGANESRQSIRESLLLVRLECCQQALMSLREALGQTCCCLVPFSTQLQSEHPRVMRIAHPLPPSALLQMFHGATHRTFLVVQPPRRRFLRHRCRGGSRH